MKINLTKCSLQQIFTMKSFVDSYILWKFFSTKIFLQMFHFKIFRFTVCALYVCMKCSVCVWCVTVQVTHPSKEAFPMSPSTELLIDFSITKSLTTLVVSLPVDIVIMSECNKSHNHGMRKTHTCNIPVSDWYKSFYWWHNFCYDSDVQSTLTLREGSGGIHVFW